LISEITRLQLLHGSNHIPNRCFDFNRVQAAVKPGAAAETTTSLMRTIEPHHLLEYTQFKTRNESNMILYLNQV